MLFEHLAIPGVDLTMPSLLTHGQDFKTPSADFYLGKNTDGMQVLNG